MPTFSLFCEACFRRLAEFPVHSFAEACRQTWWLYGTSLNSWQTLHPWLWIWLDWCWLGFRCSAQWPGPRTHLNRVVAAAMSHPRDWRRKVHLSKPTIGKRPHAAPSFSSQTACCTWCRLSDMCWAFWWWVPKVVGNHRLDSCTPRILSGLIASSCRTSSCWGSRSNRADRTLDCRIRLERSRFL